MILRPCLDEPQEGVYEMPKGLLGFSHLQSFSLQRMSVTPFWELVSTEQSSVGFTLVRGLFVTERLDFELTPQERALLYFDGESPALQLFFIVTAGLKGGLEGSTFNALGPLLFSSGRAMQVISSADDQKLQMPLMPALESSPFFLAHSQTQSQKKLQAQYVSSR